MGVFEGTDAVWRLLGSSRKSSASQLGFPACRGRSYRHSREESMVVLPPDQPPAALKGVFHLGERAGAGKMSPVLPEGSSINPIVLERAPCRSGSFGLCWGEMEEVGRAGVARQHSLYIGKINPTIMEGRDPFLACCLFLSSSVIRLARIPAAAPGNNVTFSCSKGPRGLSLVMKTGIFGSAGEEGWWRQACLVLGGKGIVGKANSLSPDTSHSCTTCFWQTFACLLFPCLQGRVLWSLL